MCLEGLNRCQVNQPKALFMLTLPRHEGPYVIIYLDMLELKLICSKPPGLLFCLPQTTPFLTVEDLHKKF